ncbi:MAG TPA: NUDIX hydrolase [Sporichthyaceae bacterium]|nr:NUDIX hydrolase [Sporichthyaceae bacterium]
MSDGELLADEPAALPVRRSVTAFRGGVVDMRTDHVLMPDGDLAVRDVLVHPGSVGVLVLDEGERVLVLRQYRHPVGRRLWELPAGLLDFPGEAPLAAAQRELAEEAHLSARQWHVLLDAYTSPGISDEAVRVYLAREATPLPGERPPGRHEEADLEARWVPLDDLLAGVAAGRLHNPLLVMSVPLLRTMLDSGGVRTLRAGDFAGN